MKFFTTIAVFLLSACQSSNKITNPCKIAIAVVYKDSLREIKRIDKTVSSFVDAVNYAKSLDIAPLSDQKLTFFSVNQESLPGTCEE